MRPFGWHVRLWYAVLAGLAGWLAGFLLTVPFEIFLAWRYVDGKVSKLPWTLAEGLVVWAAFTGFMAFAAWAPLVLPIVLLTPPRWAVRGQKLLVPAAGAAGLLAIGLRLQLFVRENFADFLTFWHVFFTSQLVFAIAFAMMLTAVYCALARVRLGE
jgi:hypothetical protein